MNIFTSFGSIIVGIIVVALTIGLVKSISKHKIAIGVAVLLFASVVIFMVNNPKQFDFVGLKLNNLVWAVEGKFEEALKNQTNIDTNVNTNFSNFGKFNNSESNNNFESDDNGKVE